MPFFFHDFLCNPRWTAFFPMFSSYWIFSFGAYYYSSNEIFSKSLALKWSGERWIWLRNLTDVVSVTNINGGMWTGAARTNRCEQEWTAQRSEAGDFIHQWWLTETAHKSKSSFAVFSINQYSGPGVGNRVWEWFGGGHAGLFLSFGVGVFKCIGRQDCLYKRI